MLITIGINEEHTRQLAMEQISEHYVRRREVQKRILPVAQNVFVRAQNPIVPARTLIECIRGEAGGTTTGKRVNRHLVVDALEALGFRKAPNKRGMILPDDLATKLALKLPPPVKKSRATTKRTSKAPAKKPARAR
ncbi:MAG: hypothetical protein ACHREM_08825 [Polyangiales bacterium]